MQQVVFLVVAIGLGVVVFKLRSDAARERKAVMARLSAERAERGDYSPTAELFREVGVESESGFGRSLAPFPPPPTVAGIDGEPPVFERLSDLSPSPSDSSSGSPSDSSFGLPGLPDLTLPVRGGEFARADAARSADTLVAETPSSAESGVDVDLDVDVEVAEVAAPIAEPAVESAVEPTAGSTSDEAGDLRRLFRGITMPAGLRPLGPLASSNASFVTDASPSDVRAGLVAEFDRLDCSATWVEPTVAQTARHGMRGLVTIYPNPNAVVDLDGEPLFPGVGDGQVVVRMLAL